MGHAWFLSNALILPSPCIFRALPQHRVSQIVRAVSIHLFLQSIIICWLAFKRCYEHISSLLIQAWWLPISCKILFKIHSTQSFPWTGPSISSPSNRLLRPNLSLFHFCPFAFLFLDLHLLCLFSFECLPHLSIYPLVLLELISSAFFSWKPFLISSW